LVPTGLLSRHHRSDGDFHCPSFFQRQFPAAARTEVARSQRFSFAVDAAHGSSKKRLFEATRLIEQGTCQRMVPIFRAVLCR
jgi:hypothetical protein